jgi:hypothetical protein
LILRVGVEQQDHVWENMRAYQSRRTCRRTIQPSFWLFELALFGLASGTFVLTPRPRRAENKNPQSGCFAGK